MDTYLTGYRQFIDMPAPAAVAKGLKKCYSLSREAATILDENQEQVTEIAQFLSDTGAYQKAVEKSREMSKKQAANASLPEKAVQKAITAQIDEVESYEEIIDKTHDLTGDEKKVAEYGARIVDILSKEEGTMTQQLGEVDQERQKAESTGNRKLLKRAFSNELQEMKGLNEEAELAIEAVTLMLRLSNQVETLSEEEKKEMNMKQEDHGNISFIEQLAEREDVDPQVVQKIKNIESREEDAVQQDEREIKEVIEIEAENISELETEIDHLIEDLNNTISEFDALENDINSASFDFPELEQQLQESRELAQKNLEKLEEAKGKTSQIEGNIQQSREALP